MTQMQGLERVKRARSQLIVNFPFYGVLALHLDMIADAKEKTMATDGKAIYVNEQFADILTDPELRGVVAHEVLHIAYGHHVRRGTRDIGQWNIAADYAINLDLISEGFKLPKGALIDRRFTGMSAEQIYATLEQDQQQQGKGASDQGEDGEGNDPGNCGGVRDAAPSHDRAGMAQAAADAQAKVFAAASIAKAQQAGTLPAAIARLVQTLRAPIEDWRSVLRRFIDSSIKQDYSWSRPNRRHIASGLYLPGMQSNTVSRVLVAVDTSGSINDALLEAFTSELQAIMDDGITDQISVVYCDTKLYPGADFDRGDSIKLEPQGGGGTKFSPVMDWAAEQQASCLIYFTDLQCSDWGDEPAMPVLWAVWGNKTTAPFGDVIPVDPNA